MLQPLKVSKGIFHSFGQPQDLLLDHVGETCLSSSFHEHFPLHYSPQNHLHICSMRKLPCPKRKAHNHHKLERKISNVSPHKIKFIKTSSKRRCTETYFPPVKELLLIIRPTILSARILIDSENLNASQFAKHLNFWTSEGTEWANLFEKGAIRTALCHGRRHKWRQGTKASLSSKYLILLY